MIGYEMQWTVRYFQSMSRKWAIPERTGTGSSSGTGKNITTSDTGTLTTGAIAYHYRKHAMWEELMIKADHVFASSNNSYQSPL